MATDCIAQVTFQGDGFAKPVVARFDRPNASTDGGLVLFKALDTALGLTQRLAACLEDAREPGKVQHETIELLQQRVFGLCGGYADCNDAARLVHGPIHKLVLGRDPLTGLGLASQPSLRPGVVDAMGRRLPGVDRASPSIRRFPGVDVPGVDPGVDAMGRRLRLRPGPAGSSDRW